MEKLIEEYNKTKNSLKKILEEILPEGIYEIGCQKPRTVKKEDMVVYSEAFQLLLQIEKKYNEDYKSRKALGPIIRQLLNDLSNFNKVLVAMNRIDRSMYANSEKKIYIKNPEEFMHTLFNAQNDQEIDYKELLVGPTESKNVTHPESILIIGDKGTLSPLTADKVFSRKEVIAIIKALEDSSKSIVLYPNLNNTTNLIYWFEIVDNLSLLISPMYFQLKDDSIRLVVERFLAFASEYDFNVDDISTDIILDNISIIPPKTIGQYTPQDTQN